MDAVALWDLFCTLCGLATLFSLAVYLVPNALLSLARPQDLRRKYGDWAVVTGGSSGIGKAVVRKLLAQRVNVCVLALDDRLLRDTHAELSAQFPDVQLRPVPVNLAGDPQDYMNAVERATSDVPVAILVNNAAYLKMGFFDKHSMRTHAANVECNVLSALHLTHYFYRRMIHQNIKGCITFTSSAALFMPSPFASMYGATKAMLTHFATSLAVEAETHGVDVTVFHPSYTHSNLYAGAPKLDIVSFLSKFGWTPDDVANVIFASVGRVIVRDLGWYAVATNLLARFVDAGFLTKAIIPFRDSMAPHEAGPESRKVK